METFTRSIPDIYRRPRQHAVASGTVIPHPGFARLPGGAYPSTAARRVPAVARRAGRPAAERWGKRFAFMVVLVWAASFGIGFVSALSLLSIIAFIAAIFGFRRPIIGLFGVSMLCTLDAAMKSFLLTGGLLRFNTVNYWLLLVMLLNVPFILRLQDLQSRIWKIFMLLMIVQLLPSADPTGGAADVLKVIVLFGLMIYFARAIARKGWDERNWYWLAFVNGLVGAVGGLSYYIHIRHLPYANPNGMSYFPNTAIFIICLAFPFTARRGQITLGVLAALNFLWVFLGASRGGLLISIVCVLFLIVELRSMTRRLGFLAIAAVICFGLWVQLSQNQDPRRNAVARMEKLMDSSQSARDRTSGRYDLALGAWYIFKSNIFGVGTGGYNDAWSKLGWQEGLSGFRAGGQSGAHSGWMKTLAENGIPGILLHAGWVFSFVVVGWRKRREPGMLALGLWVTTTLSVAFIAHEFQGKGLLLLAGLTTVLLHREAMAANVQGISLRMARRRREIAVMLHQGALRRG
jgi:O-antigen ligase